MTELDIETGSCTIMANFSLPEQFREYDTFACGTFNNVDHDNWIPYADAEDCPQVIKDWQDEISKGLCTDLATHHRSQGESKLQEAVELSLLQRTCDWKFKQTPVIPNLSVWVQSTNETCKSHPFRINYTYSMPAGEVTTNVTLRESRGQRFKDHLKSLSRTSRPEAGPSADRSIAGSSQQSTDDVTLCGDEGEKK